MRHASHLYCSSSKEKLPLRQARAGNSPALAATYMPARTRPYVTPGSWGVPLPQHSLTSRLCCFGTLYIKKCSHELRCQRAALEGQNQNGAHLTKSRSEGEPFDVGFGDDVEETEFYGVGHGDAE